MIAHYINRGYSLDKLLELSGFERLFFIAAMDTEEVR